VSWDCEAIVSKTIKYLKITLVKEVKELNTKNYKILMKEMKIDTKRENCSVFLG
jgi:hypothetical protein